jgi:hypothetical protein
VAQYLAHEDANHRVDHVPITTLTQTMGHADQGVTFGKHYRNKLAKVDVQGILMNDEQEDIDWEQYMRPERTQDRPGTLPLSTLREIEAKVCAVEGVQQRHRMRKRLRDEAWASFKPSTPLQQPSSYTSSQLIDSIERMGDLRLQDTIDRIVIDRFFPDAAIILDAWDMPDFDIRTNGLPALKALSRILRDRKNRKEMSYYYPEEDPVVDDNGNMKCGECRTSLEE